MREINFGPVFNQDGSPSDLTIEMLTGTGRTMEYFVSAKHNDDEYLDHEDVRMYGRNFGPGFAIADDFTMDIERLRYSEARRGANELRSTQYDYVVDHAHKYMSSNELIAFCDAMQIFAPITAMDGNVYRPVVTLHVR